MKLTWQHLAAGTVAAAAGWYVYRDSVAVMRERGAVARHVAPGAVRPREHQVRYPHTPGEEIQRLMHGAPGACAVAVPRELRGWLFAPPAEEDY